MATAFMQTGTLTDCRRVKAGAFIRIITRLLFLSDQRTASCFQSVIAGMNMKYCILSLDGRQEFIGDLIAGYSANLSEEDKQGLQVFSERLNTIGNGSVFTEFEKGATLSIVSSIQHTGIAPLYIERPFANLMSLSIKNQNPSGVMTTFVSGAYVGSGSMPLTVAPPTANTLPIQTRGFLE